MPKILERKMKLKKLYEHYSIITEGVNNQNIKINYNLNIRVDNGDFRAKGNGRLVLDKDIYQNIMSVEDVINYIINEETKKTNVKSKDGVSTKDILSQMLFAFMDPDSAKYLSTKDEIQFSFDYGPSDNNCIGILVSKPLGSPSFSIVMRLNRQALPNDFDKQAVDMRILTYSSLSATNE